MNKHEIQKRLRRMINMGIGIFVLLALLVICGRVFANPFLVSDPATNVTCYEIRITNTTSDPLDDQIIQVSAQADGSLKADLINFPAGENNIMVLACNVWGKSTEVPFTFDKVTPGISTNIAVVNIDGVAYIITDPQPGIIQYRVILDNIEYIVDANNDGSLMLSLADLKEGVHSIELYALNLWGESNPAPFGFTKIMPPVPQNLLLIP